MTTRVSQGVILALSQAFTPTRISQGAVLVLNREIKRRVMSIADTRN